MITQLQPSHRYAIYTNILCTNHQIFYEARAIFRENLFVRITTKVQDFRRLYDAMALTPIICRTRARDFGDIAMTITYDHDSNNDLEELCYVFAVEDLQLLCRGFHFLYDDGYLQGLAFGAVIHGSSNTLASSRSRQLLEPLTGLYAIARFTISGPANGDYKDKIISQIARPAPRYEASIEVVCELWDEGNALFKIGAALALPKYKAAILHLLSRIWDMNMIQTGKYANKSRKEVYHILSFSLYGTLATTFYSLRIFDNAFRWAEIALASLWADIGRIQYQPAQFAILTRLMASNSMALGERRRALGELGRALHHEPDNALVKADLIALCAALGRREGD